MLNQVAFLRILINLFDSAVEDEMNKKRKQYQKSTQSNYKKEKRNDKTNNSSQYSGDYLDECYKVLGVLPTATDQEVKKAWRQKALEFHPDKVQGTGLSESFVKYATEQMQKVNEAYDKICKARKNKSNN